MEIIHVSAECYPVAKAGGLGDVVGALPKYQTDLGHTVRVVMPMYRTKFLFQNEWELVHEGGQQLGPHWFKYAVIREKTNNEKDLKSVITSLTKKYGPGKPFKDSTFLAEFIEASHPDMQDLKQRLERNLVKKRGEADMPAGDSKSSVPEGTLAPPD